MGNQILNASDIAIKVGTSTIAHITDAQFQMTHEPRVIQSNDTAPGEIKLPGKLTWTLSGTSLIEMSSGYSVSDLMQIMLDRDAVAITWEALGLKMSGTGILTSLSGGGATEANATCQFSFDGNETPSIDDDDSIEEPADDE
jgi:hypothetical protein